MEHAIKVGARCQFGYGDMLKSDARVTVLVVLADHPLLLSFSVVESPVLSLLIGRDVVEEYDLEQNR